jgi:hypothetical protein
MEHKPDERQPHKNVRKILDTTKHGFIFSDCAGGKLVNNENNLRYRPVFFSKEQGVWQPPIAIRTIPIIPTYPCTETFSRSYSDSFIRKIPD